MSSFAQDVFAVNPKLTAENDILALGFEVVKKFLNVLLKFV